MIQTNEVIYVRIAVFVVFLGVVCGSTLSRQERNVVCGEIEQELLEKVLGPAFNSRYMSISEPPDNGYIMDESTKRNSMAVPDFYVDGNYARELGEEPAWDVMAHASVAVEAEDDKERPKRATRVQRQWECESKIAWSDLGPDYFPRYMRTVECTSKFCWYGRYKCTPRSFTVKILKRRRGKCVESMPGTKVGLEGLHKDLRELWVWEERAVNFCCDCSL